MSAQIVQFPVRASLSDIYRQEISIDGEYFEPVRPAFFLSNSIGIANDGFSIEFGNDIDPYLLATELAQFHTPFRTGRD